MSEPTVDPRYAAQFQRGYDGPVLAQPPATATPTNRSAPVRIEGGPPSTAARVADPPPLVARAPADEEPVDVDDEPEPPATSWIEWLLPAVGALLLAVAALLFWQSVTDTSAYLGTNSPAEQVFSDVRGLLPGPLFVAAFVAGSIGVILRAVRTRR